MPSRWQVEAVTTQMNHLDIQRNNLTTILGQINDALLRGTEWIDGNDISTSFPEICTTMELAFNEITSRCVDISREHEIHPSSLATRHVTVHQQEISADSQVVVDLKEDIARLSAESREMKDIIQSLYNDVEDKFKDLNGNLKDSERKRANFGLQLQRETSSREEQFEMVTHLLHKRLLPLEQLRDVLNRNSSEREERQTKLQDLICLVSELKLNQEQLRNTSIQQLTSRTTVLEKDMASVKAKADQNSQKLEQANTMCNKFAALDNKIKTLPITKERTKVGFTLLVPSGAPTFDVTEIITCFTNVRFNYGDHYNINTGKFTAPTTGLYLLCLNLKKSSGSVMFRIEKQEPGTNYLTPVTHLAVYANESSACHATVELLSAGDTIMLRSFSRGGLSEFSSYTGVLMTS